MFNVTPSSSAMHSLRQPSANGVTSTVFSSPHEQRISSTTGSVPDPLTLLLLPTGRAAPSRPFLLSTSQTLTRLCSQGGTEREPTARPRRIHQILAARRPVALGNPPRCRLGSKHKAQNASEDSLSPNPPKKERVAAGCRGKKVFLRIWDNGFCNGRPA